MDSPRVLFRIGPASSLQNKEVSGLDEWIVPGFCSGSSPSGDLRTQRCPDWMRELSPRSVPNHPESQSEGFL